MQYIGYKKFFIIFFINFLNIYIYVLTILSLPSLSLLFFPPSLLSIFSSFSIIYLFFYLSFFWIHIFANSFFFTFTDSLYLYISSLPYFNFSLFFFYHIILTVIQYPLFICLLLFSIHSHLFFIIIFSFHK